MANEIFLLNISGQDKPGLTSSLTSVLAEYGAKVLDIGQANIHDTLSLGIMFEINSGEKSSSVWKDLLFKSYDFGVLAVFLLFKYLGQTAERIISYHRTINRKKLLSYKVFSFLMKPV